MLFDYSLPVFEVVKDGKTGPAANNPGEYACIFLVPCKESFLNQGTIDTPLAPWQGSIATLGLRDHGSWSAYDQALPLNKQALLACLSCFF